MYIAACLSFPQYFLLVPNHYATGGTNGCHVIAGVCYRTDALGSEVTKCTFNLDLVFVNIAKIKFFFYSHKLFTEILQCDGEKEIETEVNYINYKFA